MHTHTHMYMYSMVQYKVSISCLLKHTPCTFHIEKTEHALYNGPFHGAFYVAFI